ncbi:hypothetical protein BUALT_Bualt19G0033900 [Buddleja alternifolia]|uniref:BED-type domain-containing protein n=1 Tax=Buddleja alternifolia TaxID=168488 RepID=A0AAV6W935_9LAMI|nr:hypothetical protein BUALT_Bualt19G0033900 [Buddleja alternifolia]
MDATGSQSTSTGGQEVSSGSNPRQKRDVAWNYVSEATNAEGKKTLICGFCHASFRGGGINRMKQHLAGTRGIVTPCKKVPPEVRFMIQGSLKENSEKAKEKREAIHIDDQLLANIDDSHVDNDIQEITPRPAQREGHNNVQPTSSRKRKGAIVLDSYFKSGNLDPSQPTIMAALQSKGKWHDTDLSLALWVMFSKRSYDPVDYICIDNTEFWKVEKDIEGELDNDELEDLLEEELPGIGEESSSHPSIDEENDGVTIRDVDLEHFGRRTRIDGIGDDDIEEDDDWNNRDFCHSCLKL